MDWRVAFSAAIGGFVGKLIASLFIAVCVVLGVGPIEWATYLLGGAAPWVARLVFVVLAVLAALALGFSIRASQPTHEWRLSQKQLAAIRAALTGISTGSVTIIRTASVSRIEVVHAQLVGVFRDAGWEVKEWPTIDEHSSPAPIELATAPIMQPHVLEAIRRGLSAADLQFTERDASSDPAPPVLIPRIWLSSVPASVAP